MGLIRWLRNFSGGKTEWQTEKRYERAAHRFTDYIATVQWYIDNNTSDDVEPARLDSFESLAQQNFRQEHRSVLMRNRNDIERKLRHAEHLGVSQNPFIATFFRPDDSTVYCAFVLLRDDTQNYAVMKPYWFLSSGESESDFKDPAMSVI